MAEVYKRKGGGEKGEAARRDRLWTVPNLLTAVRIVMILPFLYLIKEGSFGVALAVFFLASITDYADGYIARTYNQQSTFGRFLDPIADKLLTTASFVVMALPREGFPSIPVWLAVAVVARDIVILIGSLIVYMITGFREFKPNWLGRVNTFLELGLIVVFLAFNTLGALTLLLPICYALVMASVLVSGAGYLMEGAQIVRKDKGGVRI